MGKYINKNTKIEKVKFLKNLFLGKATIADAPTSFSLKDADTWLHVHGSNELENLRTGEIITEEEFKIRTKNKDVITFK